MTTETTYEYITIDLHGHSPSGKTSLWNVLNKKSGDLLGIVFWYSRWRQYTFQASSIAVFSAGCLDDISGFITEQMEARR